MIDKFSKKYITLILEKVYTQCFAMYDLFLQCYFVGADLPKYAPLTLDFSPYDDAVEAVG
jgi:hypothetical protein